MPIFKHVKDKRKRLSNHFDKKHEYYYFILHLFTALGIAYDKLVVNKHKIFVHSLMINWWYKVGNTVVPDLKNIVIHKILKFCRFLTKYKIFSWQYLLTVAVISWFLTSLSALFGEYLRQEPFELPYFPLYLSNFPFDLLTIVITIKTIKIISRQRKIPVIVFYVLSDIVITYFLAALCTFSTLRIGNYLSNLHSESEILNPWRIQPAYQNHYISLFKDTLLQDGFSEHAQYKFHLTLNTNLANEIKGSLIALGDALMLRLDERAPISFTITATFKEGKNEKIYVVDSDAKSKILSTYIFGALSTFTPTLMLLFIILVVILAKSIMEVSKFITTTLLDKVTEAGIDNQTKSFDPERFAPGTLTGILLGLISAFLALVNELIKMSHPTD